MNTYTALMNYIADMTEAARGNDEVLAYIDIRESDGDPACVTDLVYARRFGTGPTVHRKITSLEKNKFIQVKRAKDDGRAKLLSITPKGREYLERASADIKVALAGAL